MTRFARAKGSKASNERTPEEATSWLEMKTQMLKKDDEPERKQFEEERRRNYDKFLEEREREEAGEVKWAEFDNKPKGKIISQNIKGKGKNNKETSGELSSKTELKASSVKVKKARNKKKTALKTVKKGVNEEKVNYEKKDLTEDELKRIEKKKLKMARQAEKRKKFKEEMKKREEEGIEEQKLPLQNRKRNEKSKLKKQNLKGEKFERNKNKNKPEKLIINGKQFVISYIEGFPVKKEDADRLKKLKKQMIAKGLPRSQINASLKLERRKAEKALAREKKNVCFNCRKSGHNLSECPELNKNDGIVDKAGCGICFKCGSTEHTQFQCKVVQGQEFKFARCFICNEQGHISRQCPDNARGLYPKGGACRVCGDVTHLKKDCPQFQVQQQQNPANNVKIDVFDDRNPDLIEDGSFKEEMKKREKEGIEEQKLPLQNRKSNEKSKLKKQKNLNEQKFETNKPKPKLYYHHPVIFKFPCT